MQIVQKISLMNESSNRPLEVSSVQPKEHDNAMPGLVVSFSDLDDLRSDIDSNDNTAAIDVCNNRLAEDGTDHMTSNGRNNMLESQCNAIPSLVTSLSDSHLDELRHNLDSCEPTVENLESSGNTGLKVLFLSSDTGGGHRASAESLANQFQILFPGTTYDLLDVVEKDGVPPYNSLVTAYKHLSNRPSQWKLVYSVSNSRAFEVLADAHLKLMCERAVRRRIKSYNPDVVVSVHPLMTNVPVLSCANISAETGKHLPIFTVVTDLGSAHCLWFANGVEKMFVGSQAVKELAKARGKVPEEKLVLAGLPIRNDFAVQAELLGDRYSREGREYQRQVRQALKLPLAEEKVSVGLTEGAGIVERLERPVLLVMGGGEGVGSLENITDALYVELTYRDIDALVLVVCGRNEKLKSWIERRKWSEVFERWLKARRREEMKANGFRAPNHACVNVPTFPNISLKSGCIEIDGVTDRIRNLLRYTTPSRSVKAVMSNAPATETSDKSDNFDEIMSNCSGDELITTATAVFAHLQYGEIDDDAKIRDAERQEAFQQVDQLVVDSEFELKPKSEAATKSGSVATSIDSESYNSLAGSGVPQAKVTVVGLGFVNNMAEYMVASDILLTKAGPGTISEAAALSLPVMLTSYLPGQEEGNVDFVVNGGFGAYCSVNDPIAIAEQVCSWLQNEEKLKTLSKNAKLHGTPYAARDIAKAIGESTLRWKEHNRDVEEKRKLVPVVKSRSTFSLLSRRRSEANVSSKQ